MVVEDSDVGLQAAQAAGMQVVWFTGGGHMRAHNLSAGARGAPSVRPTFQISALTELTGILSGYAVGGGGICHGG